MKKQSIQTIAKRFFLGNLLAATLFLSANAATVTPVAPAADKVEIKYTGVDKYNQLSFNVKYSNPAGNTFNLSVLDEYGEILFKGFYGDKQFDKTFKLPKSEVSKLTFVIEDGKNSFKQKFDVNIKTQVIEDVVVSKN
ncbi:MAG: hypothetical protein HYU71_04625 [Bacteroidetes bacterium]|nr:hypothetical protein [Bacteroidota bacterium]